MLRRRLINQGHDITMTQCYVRISNNPNGTHDVFLHSTMGVITCSRYIRHPRHGHYA